MILNLPTVAMVEIRFDVLNQLFTVRYADERAEGFTFSQFYQLREVMDNSERAAMEYAIMNPGVAVAV